MNPLDEPNEARDAAHAQGKHFFDRESERFYFFQGADKPYHVTSPMHVNRKFRPNENNKSFFYKMTEGPKASFDKLECVGL